MTVRKISIVIVNWNGERFLEKCLGSLARQDFRRFEIVFVDNGSTDGSVRFVEANYPEVKVIRNAKNLGFAKANNQGIEASGGDFVLTLNNDTEVRPDFLSEMARSAEASDGSTGMWAPKILSMEGRDVIDSVGGLLIYPDGLAKGRGRLEIDRGQYDGAEEVFIPSACAALYRRAMLDSIGLFDEDFFAYCEDTDLGLRGRLAGWKTMSAPKAVVYHYYSGTGGRYTPFKAYLVERNHLWAAIKSFPPGALLACPYYVVKRYVVQAYGVVTGRGAGGRFVEGFSAFGLIMVLVKAYLGIIAGAPRMLSRRRKVQRLRRATPAEFRSWLRRYAVSATDLVLKD